MRVGFASSKGVVMRIDDEIRLYIRAVLMTAFFLLLMWIMFGE